MDAWKSPQEPPAAGLTATCSWMPPYLIKAMNTGEIDACVRDILDMHETVNQHTEPIK